LPSDEHPYVLAPMAMADGAALGVLGGDGCRLGFGDVDLAGDGGG
jgi:hypothetical protein